MDQPDDAPGAAVTPSATLTSGPPRYVPKGPWGPVSALLVGTVLAAGLLAIALAAIFLAASLYLGVSPDDFTERQFEIIGLFGTGVWLILVAAGIWFVSGLRGGVRREVLHLNGPLPAVRDIVLAFVAILLLQSVLQGALYLYDPEWLLASYRSDVGPYLALWRDPDARLIVPAVLVIAVILAPLGEEFLFRGFLLSGLAKARWGFWPPAILSTAIWTAIHVYSLSGTLAVATYGLCFSWLLWRSGSLWLPIICHALVNVWAMAAVSYMAWS